MGKTEFCQLPLSAEFQALTLNGNHAVEEGSALPEIKLVRDPLADALTNFIVKEPMDEEALFAKLQAFVVSIGGIIPAAQTTFNVLSEMNIRIQAERFFAQMGMSPAPIRDSFQNSRFELRRRKQGGSFVGSIWDAKKNVWKQVTDYDGLYVVNGKIYVVEDKRGRDRKVERDFEKAIDLSVLPQRLGPVAAAHTVSEMCYSVVVASELFDPHAQNQKDFAGAGGLIVQHETPYQTYSQAAYRLHDRLIEEHPITPFAHVMHQNSVTLG